MSYSQGCVFSAVQVLASNIIPLALHILNELDADDTRAQNIKNAQTIDEKIGLKVAQNAIESYLNDEGWDVSFDNETGSINHLQFERDTSTRTEETVLNLMAPFVVKGSYIQMEGEDFSIWRWVFNGEEMIVDYPEIKWQDPNSF